MRKRIKFTHKTKRLARLKARRLKLLQLRQHPFVVPVIAFLALFFIALIGFVFAGGRTLQPSDSHIVILFHDQKTETLPTRAQTVGELLKRHNITINEGDVVEPSVDTKIPEDNFKINVYRARPVTIVEGNHKISSLSAASTPRTIAEQAGVTLYPEDIVSIAPSDNFLRDGITAKVSIKRATPIRLNIYGSVFPVRTQASSVKDLLKEKNIKLAEGDTVQPAENSTITVNEQVFILRKGTALHTEEQDIPTPIRKIKDTSLSYGTVVVRQKGAPGKKIITYITTADGQRQVVQEVIIQAPVIQIVVEGSYLDISGDKTTIMAAAGISSGDYGAVNYIISRESNWHVNARNASGCLGLGQRCPGSILISACPNWDTDPVCQLRHFSAYAGRYGGWGGAYAFWQSHGYW